MCIDQVARVKPQQDAVEEWRPFGPKLALERQNADIDDMPQITLGSTRLSDYTKISVLGKGTYGEVYKCVHN